jgi:hypothetical protein
VDRAGLDGDRVASVGHDLLAVLPELDRAALDLELLGLVRVHVAGDAATGSDRGLDQHVLAAGVARGLVERDALAGDGILDCLSGGDHFGFLLVPWGVVLDALNLAAPGPLDDGGTLRLPVRRAASAGVGVTRGR